MNSHTSVVRYVLCRIEWNLVDYGRLNGRKKDKEGKKVNGKGINKSTIYNLKEVCKRHRGVKQGPRTLNCNTKKKDTGLTYNTCNLWTHFLFYLKFTFHGNCLFY